MAKIKFKLPAKLKTKLLIYDILGKEVITVLNKKMSTGDYEIDFSSLNLTNGTYFYKLIVEGFSETKKITLA